MRVDRDRIVVLLHVLYWTICIFLGVCYLDSIINHTNTNPFSVVVLIWDLASSPDPVFHVLLKLIVGIVAVVVFPGWLAVILAFCLVLVAVWVFGVVFEVAVWLAKLSPVGGGIVAMACIAVVIFSVRAVRNAMAERTALAKLKSCPSCGGNESQIEIYDTKYSEYQSTRTETRRTTHHNRLGEETGYSENEIEVPCTETSVTFYRKCKQCSHTWTSSR